MNVADAEIIEQIRKGKKHLFAALIDRYKARGMTLALGMLKVREEAEEALADAFIRAYNGLDRFEGASGFGTWFYRILYNVCLSRLGKRKGAFTRVDLDDETGYVTANEGTSPDAIKELEAKEKRETIARIIRQMPEKYAVMLTMFYLEELSHAEICEVTGMPLGTVKIRLSRARAIIMKELKKEFHEERIHV